MSAFATLHLKLPRMPPVSRHRLYVASITLQDDDEGGGTGPNLSIGYPACDWVPFANSATLHAGPSPAVWASLFFDYCAGHEPIWPTCTSEAVESEVSRTGYTLR